MIRAPMGTQKYWDEKVNYGEQRIKKEWELIKQSSANPVYDPQYTFDTAKSTIFRYILRRYSRGDAILDLSQHFGGLLDAWELSNKLAAELNAHLKPGESWDHRHLLIIKPTNDPRGHTDPRSWIFELSWLNHYNWCFWLVGLALALEIPDDQWQRLLILIGGEGEDVLLDRVIASRQPNRKIGTKLLHKKPYARLLKAVEAKDKGLPQTQQAELLRNFVSNWYTELERKGNNELWWHTYGNENFAGGSYFGRWCIEAVAAVKAFGLDDSLCLGHEHYPGDLLRPNQPSTHPAPGLIQHDGIIGWVARLLNKRNAAGKG